MPLWRAAVGLLGAAFSLTHCQGPPSLGQCHNVIFWSDSLPPLYRTEMWTWASINGLNYESEGTGLGGGGL